MATDCRPFVLAETTWKNIKQQDFEIAVLPWGATEAHNYHLPYGTDNIIGDGIGIDSCEKTWQKGAKALLLPTIPFGINTGQMDIKFCMNINPSTQYAILKDTVTVLQNHGIKKFVILNAHGGNNFKSHIRELSIDFPEVFTCCINWFTSVNPNDYFDDPGGHAGELETSMVLHYRPELVLPLSEAGDGIAKQFKLKGLKEGWVTAQRQWTKVTQDTGIGNPKQASAAKGKVYTEAVSDRIAEFLTELHNTAIEDLYE
ncbi:creatininase family protein [Zunongwangia sp.]|uniref:creatininase family protein n=1 Tax=Zunongwangia sp. TaxID=1965325 RepID=UPI003AA7B8D5